MLHDSRDTTATCPNGHPLAVGQLVCDICAGTAHRRRFTAQALLFLPHAERMAAARQRRADRTRGVLMAVSLCLLAASVGLLVVRRTAPVAGAPAAVATTAPLSFPPIVEPATSTTLSPTSASGCPQNAYADLTAERATGCLYLAWKTRDQRGTQFYASVPAVEALFARPWEPPDRPFEGCGTATGGSGIRRQSCRYRGITMQVDCTAAQGCSVTSVSFGA